MDNSKKLKKRWLIALASVLIILSIGGLSTYAWYIYNTSTHTTSVHMAAGAGSSLEISKSYAGPYGSSTVLDEFVGVLNPVSTDNIFNGFQKVTEFRYGGKGEPVMVANTFGIGEPSDYYRTTLYLRTSAREAGLYISNIGYEDADKDNPISTAIRVGIVTYAAGNEGAPLNQYIFEITDKENPKGVYNTETGKQGYVLDSTKTDGTTIPFTAYNAENFISYDEETGATALKPNTVKLADIVGDDGKFGTPVRVDVYIWLEGCDKDCYNNLCTETLNDLSIGFALY